MADIDSFTTYVQGQLTDVIAAAEAAAGDLEAVAEGYVDFFTFNPPPDYDDTTQMVNFAPASVTMDAVAPFSAPAAPTFPVIAAPTVTPIDPVDFTEANAALAGLDLTSFDPATIDGEIAGLAAKVLAFIDSGGPGISDAVQTALMDNMRERDLQILDDALLRVRSSDALSGFPFPTSITQAAQNEITKKYQDDYSNRNREILALMTERAHQTAMNGLNAGVQLTQIKSGLITDVWKLHYSLQGLILEEFKALLGAEQTRVETELRKILADYEVYKTRMMTEYNVKLEEFKVLASGEEVRVRAETALATAKAEVAVKANDHLLRAAVAEVQAQIEKWVKTADILTERGKANIQQLVSNNQIRVHGAGQQAQLYSGVVNACAQMVNTVQVKKT
jgi:hypothetical protein